MSVRSLLGGQAVVFLTSLLSLSSAVLIPFSAEAISIDLRGDGCEKGGSTARNCAYVLSTSALASKATIAVLVVMSVTTICLISLLRNWPLGVYTNPWSICTLASLSLNQEVRQLVANTAACTEMHPAEERVFKLDCFRGSHNSGGPMEYGVIALDDSYDAANNRPQNEGDYEAFPLNKKAIHDEVVGRSKDHMPFMLSIPGRLVLLFMLCGVLVLILYYAQTGGDTGFERFLDSDSFGVRFLFTSFGVIISFSWSSFFDSKLLRAF
jgi:hypothetical protein